MSGSEHSQNLPIEQVQHSETQKEMKSETIYQLKLANQILERYKNKYGENWSKFEQVKKEYNDIKIATIEALKSERAIIQSELQSIQKEIGDLKNIESLSDRWFNTKPAYIDEEDQMDFGNASETTKEQDKNSENISIFEMTSTAIKQIASKTIQATNEIIFEKDNSIAHLNTGINQIQSPLLRKYIQEEIDALQNGKDVDTLTRYYLTLVANKEYAMTNTTVDEEGDTGNDVTRAIHNETQQEYMDQIMGTSKGFNDTYVRGYSNEDSNFLVKIEDIKATIYTTDVINFNSRALANYVAYIHQKEGDLTQEILIRYFGEQNTWSLIQKWKTENSTSKTILETAGLGNVIKGISNSATLSQNMKEQINVISNISGLSDLFIKEHPKYLGFVDQKEHLMRILNLPTNTEKKENIKNLNPKFYNDIEVLKFFDLTSVLSLSYLPTDLWKDEKFSQDFIREFCTNKVTITYAIQLMATYNPSMKGKKLYDLLSQNFAGYNTPLPKHILDLIQENDTLTKDDFLQAYKNFEANYDPVEDIEENPIIESYIFQYGIEGIEEEIEGLIIKGYIPETLLFNNNNKKVALWALTHDPSIITRFSEELRGDYNIIKMLINTTGAEPYYPFIKANNFNDLMHIFSTIKDKIQKENNGISQEALIQKIMQFMGKNMNTRLVSGVQNIISTDASYLSKYNDDIQLLQATTQAIDRNTKTTHQVWEKLQNIRNNNEKVEHNIDFILTQLQTKGVDITSIKRENIETLFSHIDNTGKISNPIVMIDILKKTFNIKKDEDLPTFFKIILEINDQAISIQENKNMDDMENKGIDTQALTSIIEKLLGQYPKIKEETESEYYYRIYQKIAQELGKIDTQNIDSTILKHIETIINRKHRKNRTQNSDIYYQYLFEEHKTSETFEEYLEKKQDKKAIINKVEIHDSTPRSNYILEDVSKTDTSYNITVNGATISNLTSAEYSMIIEKNEEGESIIKNPEALKNLVDFKAKMNLLGLDFAWEYRTELIQLMENTHGFKGMEMNTADDFINKAELNNFLKFILFAIGEKFDEQYSGNISKIISINQVTILNNKTDTRSGLSNIGYKFIELGLLNKSGKLELNGITKATHNLQNRKTVLKK